MIHIVFQQKNAEVLNKAIHLDEELKGDLVVLEEDFSIGPVQNIYETEGYRERKNFLEEVEQFSSVKLSEVIDEDKLKVHGLKKQIDENENEVAWIWLGQNPTDVCGYFWLMPQLKKYQGRIFILYLNNLPFINEKGGIFYPRQLFEILPKEFLKAKRLARPITLSEFEIEPDEWQKLMNENAGIRILEGGKKLIGKDYDFYDNDILQLIAGENTKLPKLLNAAESKLKQRLPYAFIVWRLRTMSDAGLIHLNGNFEKGLKDMEVLKPFEVSNSN